MKKIITSLFIVCSALAMAKNPFSVLEDKLELKYGTLTDAQGNTITVDSVDVDSMNGNLFVKLEIEPLMGDGGWSKFDKNSYKKIATQIANEVRQASNTTGKIEVYLVKDNDITDKKTLLDTGMF